MRPPNMTDQQWRQHLLNRCTAVITADGAICPIKETPPEADDFLIIQPYTPKPIPKLLKPFYKLYYKLYNFISL